MKRIRLMAPLFASISLLVACGGGDKQPTASTTKESVVAPTLAVSVQENAPDVPALVPAANWRDETEVGIGLYELSYWDQSFAMADVVRQSQFRDMNWGYDLAPDANGVPTKDFRLMISSIAIGAGTYKLQFKGRASVGGATNVRYDATSNTTTADVVFSQTKLDNTWLDFTNTRRTAQSSTADGVSDIHLWRPGYPTDGSAVFTREFLTAMQKFHVIRTMDFVFVNSNPTERWNERTRIDFQGYTDTKGQSWELMVLLANAAGRDLWINVPVKANDEYIRKLALLIKYGSDGNEPYTSPQQNPKYPPLRSDLKVYVEYGNEIWNTSPGFRGFEWSLNFANQHRLDTTHPIAYDGPVDDQWRALRRWIAYRSSHISQTFRTVFGDMAMMSRVRPILATQVGNANEYLKDALLWAEGYHGNAKDIWFGGGGAAYYESTADANNPSAEALSAYFAGLPTTEFGNKVGIDAIWTKGFGLKTVAYEGGPMPGGSSTGNIKASDDVIYQFNNDTRMKSRMQAAHSIWQANGGDMLVYYVYSAPAPWSFTNGAAKPTVSDTNSVKLQAIDAIRASAATAPTLGTAIPGTVYLRASNARTIDWASGGTQWGYNGTAYRLTPDTSTPSKSEFVLVPTHTTQAGTYRVALNVYDADATHQVEVFANGKLLGTVTPRTSPPGQATLSTDVTAELPAGLTVFRLRAKAGPGTWIKDIVVTR